MAQRLDIVNLALARIGQAPISAIDEASTAATAASLAYDSCRRAVLQSYPWSFAMRTARLARDTGSSPDYAFSYALPPDCLQPVRLQARRGDDRGAALSFCIRGKSLLANEPEAVLEYVSDVTDEAAFEPRFVEAFVIRLASELAMPVGAKAELMSAYRNEYEQIVRQAGARSASQFYEERSDNPYLDARL